MLVKSNRIAYQPELLKLPVLLNIIQKLTFPVRETSPVMARFCWIGLLRASERRAVIMVHPADGPSFGVAPLKRKHEADRLRKEFGSKNIRK